MRTRAAVCWEAGQPWDVTELELSEPGSGELLVKMEYAGLCHSDDHNTTGDFPAVLPLVGGHEGAGEVVAVGAGVNRISVGDAVIFGATATCGSCRWCADGRGHLCDSNADVMAGARADGTYAFNTDDGRGIGAYAQLGTFSEYTMISQTRAIRFERDIPSEVAAVMSCAIATGLGSAVRIAEVRHGDTVVVVGVGGVGMGAVQGARIAGAAQIVAVDPVQFKREQALKLGATHTATSIADAGVLISEITRNAMADAAIVTPGVLKGEMIGPITQLVGKGGAVVLTAVPRYDDTSVSLPLLEVFLSAKRILGCVMGNTRPTTDFHRIFDLYRAGELHVNEMITRTYSLDQINEGYADMHKGINIRGVIRF